MTTIASFDVKSIRIELGKSQREFASLLGVSARALQSYEQGWRVVPPIVQRMAWLLLYVAQRKSSSPGAACWTTRRCGAAEKQACASHTFDAPDLCWLMSGNRCRGNEYKTWEEKAAVCVTCPVVKRWWPR